MLVLLWLFHGILSLTHYSTVQLKNKLLPSLEVEASSQEMSVPIYILLSTSFFFHVAWSSFKQGRVQDFS